MEMTDFDITKWTALPIVTFPHPLLGQKTEPVTAFNDELKTLVHRMLVTMYQEPGCGLSANQVGVSKRVFVTDTDYTIEEDEAGNKEFVNTKPRVFINPRFKQTAGEQICEEGCLSFPGITVDVTRFMDVTVEFEGLDGQTRELSATEFFSNCLQHEFDHLEGVTFLDRLSPMKRQLATRKYLKQRRS